MRIGVLERLHDAHQGITKCRERAKASVWWPGLSQQLDEVVKKCPTCIKECINPAEPVIPSELSDRPWQKVAADLFELKGHPYLLVIDYFSRYEEVAKLSHTTSPDVIVHLQSMFARHSIPEQLISDNGPQFSSTSFSKFAEDYGFTHILTSPQYPQANGEVERVVQTVKNLLKKTPDPYKALMAYRATPLESGPSLAELPMGRKIRTRIPTSPSNLKPSWPYLEQFREKDASLKERQRRDFDRRHSAEVLPDLLPGECVWLPDKKVEGTVVDIAGPPRSYTVETPKGQLRRNRRHLNRLPETHNADTSTVLNSSSPDVRTAECPEPTVPATAASSPVAPTRTTRCGREIRTPERFRDL